MKSKRMIQRYAIKNSGLIALFAVFACAVIVTSAANPPNVLCQILDQPDDTIWYASGSYADGARVAGGSRLRMLETRAGAGLFYARTPAGEFDLHVKMDATTFIERGDLRMPDQVAALRLNLDYVARLQDGYSLRMGFAPGFYSQITHLNTDHIYFPFSLHGLYAFSPEATAVFGFNFYPGFDRFLEPQAGVRWGISHYLTLDVFYPSSEVVFRPAVNWALRAGVDFKRKTEYRLKRADERQSLIMKETRLYVEVARMITPELRMMVRLGRIVDRDLDFKRQTPARGVEDSGYLQIGVAGVF